MCVFVSPLCTLSPVWFSFVIFLIFTSCLRFFCLVLLLLLRLPLPLPLLLLLLLSYGGKNLCFFLTFFCFVFFFFLSSCFMLSSSQDVSAKTNAKTAWNRRKRYFPKAAAGSGACVFLFFFSLAPMDPPQLESDNFFWTFLRVCWQPQIILRSFTGMPRTFFELPWASLEENKRKPCENPGGLASKIVRKSEGGSLKNPRG